MEDNCADGLGPGHFCVARVGVNCWSNVSRRHEVQRQKPQAYRHWCPPAVEYAEPSTDLGGLASRSFGIGGNA